MEAGKLTDVSWEDLFRKYRPEIPIPEVVMLEKLIQLNSIKYNMGAEVPTKTTAQIIIHKNKKINLMFFVWLYLSFYLYEN